MKADRVTYTVEYTVTRIVSETRTFTLMATSDTIDDRIEAALEHMQETERLKGRVEETESDIESIELTNYYEA